MPSESTEADQVNVVLDAMDRANLRDAMLEHVRTEVPMYRDLVGTPHWAEVETHCDRHLEATMRSLRRGQPPSAPELEFVAEQARLRVHQGIPLAGMLHSYRAGYLAVWRGIAAAAAEVGAPPAAILELGELAMSYFNAISGALTEAYLREEQVLERSRARDRADAVRRLLTADPEVGTEHAAVLAESGLASDQSIVIVSVRLEEGSAAAELVIRLSETLGRGRPALVAEVHERVVAILPVEPDGDELDGIREVLEATRDSWDLRAGVSVSWPRLDDAAAAFADAERAAELTSSRRPIVLLSEVSLLDDLLARADRTTSRLVGAWLTKLQEENDKLHGELLDTLYAFLREGFSVTRSAKRLDVHPNTVRYRLGRIETVTGKSVRRFEDLVEIVIGLRLRQPG